MGEASRIGRRVQQDDAEGSELFHDQVSELLGGVTAQVDGDNIGQQPGQLAVVEPGRQHRKVQLAARLRTGEAWQDDDLIFCQADGRPWNPDHVSKRFKKLAAQASVPVIKLHEGGRHTGNSLMRDAGVDQEVRMREVGHAGKDINDRYTHVLIEAHLAAAEQTAPLVREAGKTAQ